MEIAGNKRLKLGSRSLRLPNSKLARIVIGGAFALGGLLGALPVLGFWMIPLGLMVLSADVPSIRRLRRRADVQFGRWRRRRWLAEG